MNALSRPTAAGLVASGLLACLALAPAAQAVPFSGTFTYGGGTNQNYTPNGPDTELTDATSVNEGTDQSILTLTGVPGAPGQVGQLITYANTLLNIPATASGVIGATQISWGVNNRFTFASSGGTYLRDSVNNALNFLWLGTFTDAMGVFNTQVAQFTQGWSQAASGQLPNTGGTFNSSPSLTLTPAVPEPASIALFGIGLLGLGYVVRRRSHGAERALTTA